MNLQLNLIKCHCFLKFCQGYEQWVPEFTNGVYPFLQPSYTDPGYMSLIHTKDDHNQAYAELNSTQINSGTTDPGYMSLIHTKDDHNQAYAELNSTQINSGTTERHWEPDYLEPVATIKYQNALEMKTYANTQVATISYVESFWNIYCY